MKTPIEKGSESKRGAGDFRLIELLFRTARLPLVSRVHPWIRGRVHNIRYLPVNESLEVPEGAPLPIDLLYRLIEEASHRMLIDYCVCRKSCGCARYPHEVGCLVLGDSGLQIPESVHREATVIEAKAYAGDAVAKGLIPFVGKIRLDNLLYGIRDRGRLSGKRPCL